MSSTHEQESHVVDDAGLQKSPSQTFGSEIHPASSLLPHSSEISTPISTTGPHFLMLPLELRLEIYAHLLTLPAGDAEPTAGQRLHPAILLACRQVHREAVALLYRGNRFEAHEQLLADLPRLRKGYEPVKSAALAALIGRFSLRVRLDCTPAYDRDRAAAAFTGKEELLLDVWQAQWRGAGPDVLARFEGVRGLRTVRISGSIGGFEGYASWLEGAMTSPVGAVVEEYRGVELE